MKKEKQLVFRTARIYYLTNYIIVALVLIIMALVSPMLNIFGNMLHLAIFFTLLAIASAFAEEPEWKRLFRKYVITNNEVKQVEGLLDKKEIILPFQSVADVTVTKTFLGRLLNYGTVQVRGFKDGGDVIMRGVVDPEVTRNVIQHKINLVRETTLKAWKK